MNITIAALHQAAEDSASCFSSSETSLTFIQSRSSSLLSMQLYTPLQTVVCKIFEYDLIICNNYVTWEMHSPDLGQVNRKSGHFPALSNLHTSPSSLWSGQSRTESHTSTQQSNNNTTASGLTQLTQLTQLTFSRRMQVSSPRHRQVPCLQTSSAARLPARMEATRMRYTEEDMLRCVSVCQSLLMFAYHRCKCKPTFSQFICVPCVRLLSFTAT